MSVQLSELHIAKTGRTEPELNLTGLWQHYVATVQSGPVLVSGPQFQFGLVLKLLELIIHLSKMDLLCSHVDWIKINSTYL